MAATNFTTADAAAGALVNAAARQGITPSSQLAAHQLPLSVLANLMDGQAGGASSKTTAGTGFTGGTGTILKSGISTEGGIIRTTFLIDLTGLGSSTTDLDIIGTGANPAFFARLTAAENGTIIGGSMKCLEVPAGGVVDIDLYKATVATGVFDGAVTSLTGQGAVVTSGGNWTLNRELGIAPDGIAANDYLYLAGGAAGTAAAYTAGRILITLFGV